MDQLLVSIPVFNSQGVDQLEESRRMPGNTSLPSIPHHHTSINNIYFYSDIICVWVVNHKYLDELNPFRLDRSGYGLNCWCTFLSGAPDPRDLVGHWQDQ